MEEQRFYRFSHNSVYTRGFTWAMSIVPRSEQVAWGCPSCGRSDRYPSGSFDVIVEGGVKYPDVLGCGAYPFLIVSGRVVSGWLEAGITCFHTFSVGIAKVKSKRLQEVTPPPYYRVEINGQCRIDLVASGAEVIQSCPRCGRFQTKPTLLPSFRMVPDSWDGCDIFRDEVLFPRVNFCTQKVLELARQHRWTNFRFEPMEGPFDSASKGIDYLKGRLAAKRDA